MLPEFGLFALILAFILAFFQSIVPLIGLWFNQSRWLHASKPLAYMQAFWIIFSFFSLMLCFWQCDFSVQYVWENANTHLPLFYRLAGVWGAHEGSMLLWLTVLAFWMVAVAYFSKTLPEYFIAQVLAIMSMVSFGFLWFILATSNPFIRTFPSVPLEGQDLNPLLQDPGLITHPPMLYMGYVGFSVAFAFAIAALLSGRLDQQWAKWTRPWTIAAWGFLTLGITLGSWWSYRVLGWGGWWFWDPVENASFMPWLVGTALIHSLIVTEKRGAFKSWTALLAILTFSLSLIGTFLVRSGILNSVHAFAVDPTRGAFILKFLTVIIGSSLFLFACRASNLVNKIEFTLWSRENFLFLNNIFLVIAMFTVLLGTLYPLALDALSLNKISVGSPYFNLVFTPMALPFLFLMGIGPRLMWQSSPLKKYLKSFLICLLFSTLLTFILLVIVTNKVNIYAYLGLSVATWIILNTILSLYEKLTALSLNNSIKGYKKYLALPQSTWGMVIAHLGLAVIVIGISVSTQYSSETNVKLAPGDRMQLGNYTWNFIQSSALQGPNYSGIAAHFLLEKNDNLIASLIPEKRVYKVDQLATSLAAIHSNLFEDLYLVLGQPLGHNAWAVRIYEKPFVRWIWFGGLLMVFAAFLSIWSRRKI